MRSLRSSSRLNSRTLSEPDLAVAFQSTWRAESSGMYSRIRYRSSPRPRTKVSNSPGDHGQNLEKFVRRFHARINNDFAGKRHPPGLGQKCKRKAGCQAEAFLLITSAALETKFDVGSQFSACRHVRKIRCSLKYARQDCSLSKLAAACNRETVTIAVQADVPAEPRTLPAPTANVCQNYLSRPQLR